MPKIKPLHDKVLIERLEAEETTAGGILLPDSAKEKPTEGKVVATGDGRTTDAGERVPLTLKVGDRVLFSSYAGTNIKSEGKEYLILDEAEVLAIVDDAPLSRGKGGKTKKKKKAGRKKKSASRKKSR